MAVGAACFLLLNFADRWWPATVLAFAPRWPLVLPAAMLLPLALLTGQRLWTGIITIAAGLVLSVYMGLRFPFPHTRAEAGDDGVKIRVATFNIRDTALDTPWVRRFITDADADLIALQECKPDALESGKVAGYHAKYSDTHCLLSRFPITAVDARDRDDAYALGGNAAIVRFGLDVQGRTIQVVLVHLETIRKGFEALRYERLEGVPALEANTALRRWESGVASAWSRRGEGPRLVIGDFNMPVESAIYREYWSHLKNAFDACGTGYGWTKHTRWYGIRIDHVLMDTGWTCDDAFVGVPGQSDHVPLYATLRLH